MDRSADIHQISPEGVCYQFAPRVLSNDPRSKVGVSIDQRQ
ncbi:hypothetical protein RBSH_03212 [Rhodopirellula baltica SH28]|uniref:Uncharacterized protein n=1 Tax=Rhodopirellula baltica SH28 TaxID=993517 RepID=K5E6P8_RHOBT|nr:hypothetical protein RBSH_03212 [Rhodopirellula baltica SH28]